MEKVEYKKAMVEQKVPYIKKIVCDRCKRIIHKTYGKEFINETVKYHPSDMASWYSVTTGHNDWGNDSCESVERFDVCPKCITEVYAGYVERSSGGYNSKYIEIRHCYGWTLPLDEEAEES